MTRILARLVDALLRRLSAPLDAACAAVERERDRLGWDGGRRSC